MAANPQQDARDLLEEAVAMLEFMAEVSPVFAADNKMTTGMNANAAYGLGLIFDHINKTIGQASALI